MEISDLMTTYWSQTTLILLGIGYLIKRMLDNKSKKIEINHSLVQQNRIITVNKFFSNYAKTELMWNQIEIFDILSRKVNVREIDAIVFPTLNSLKETLFELKIYFKTEDHKYFEDLTDEIISINGVLSNLYFSSDRELNLTEKSNEFEAYKNEILRKNKEKMEDLCNIIRKAFESYY